MKNKPNKQHGNYARIDPKTDIIPMYLTNCATPKDGALKISQENGDLSTEEVNANHK